MRPYFQLPIKETRQRHVFAFQVSQKSVPVAHKKFLKVFCLVLYPNIRLSFQQVERCSFVTLERFFGTAYLCPKIPWQLLTNTFFSKFLRVTRRNVAPQKRPSLNTISAPTVKRISMTNL